MKPSIFIDTSGFYALLVRDDPAHPEAAGVMKQAREKLWAFVTTDYVLDETATLMMARGKFHLIESLWSMLDTSRACRIEWMDTERFKKTKERMLRHRGRPFSFTDCSSFVIANELKLQKVLTKDAHFREMGFEVLLPGA